MVSQPPERSAPAAPSAPLSPRQVEILRLIAAGLTDKQVALALGVSRKTVGTHVQRLYKRLGVHSRAQALAVWSRLLEPPSEDPAAAC